MRARDTAAYTLGLLLQQAATFAVSVAVARGLGPAPFGAFSVLKTIAAFLLIVTPLGLDLCLLKHGALLVGSGRRFDDLAIKLRSCALLANAGVAALTIAGAGRILQGVYGTPRFWLYADITILGLAFASDLQVTGALFRVHEKLTTYVLVVMVWQPVARLLATLAAIGLDLGLLGVTAANALASAATFAILQGFAPARVASPRRIVQALRSGVAVASILAESAWMSSAMLAYQSMRFLDVLILGALAGVEAAGEYSALGSVCQMIQVYPLAVSQMLGPTIAKLHACGRRDDIIQAFDGYMRVASLIGGFIFGGIAVFGTDLDLVFGRSFHFAPALSLVLATACFLGAIFAPLGYALSMTGRHRAEFAIVAGGTLMLACSLGALVPFLGQVGAAIAVLATMVAVNMVRCVLVSRLLRACPVRFAHVVPPLAFLALAAACRLASGALVAQRSFFVLCLTCALYAGLALALYLSLFRHAGEREATRRLLSRLLPPRAAAATGAPRLRGETVRRRFG